MDEKIVLTGDRPTGPLHIGHLSGALRRRVAMQNSGEYRTFVMIADAQALIDNADNPAKVRKNVLEVALDNMAVGVDPNKSTLFIQSEVSELTELYFYYMNLVTLSRAQRNPTVKSELAEKKDKFGTSIPLGFLTYPISQTADITAFNATHIPVGEDQLPVIEQAQEIVQKFNNTYGPTLVMPKGIVEVNEKARRLLGTDGGKKMGKSIGNVINLSDDPDTISRKIMTMYTDPNHLRVQDPGQTENNPVFQYISVFSTPEHFKAFLPEYENYQELAAHYQQGGLGDVKVKRFLNEVMQDVLRPIRERRLELAKDPDAVWEILRLGTIKARAEAALTLKKVKKAMQLDYFKQ
ncbi:MAG: tryptophan--tRNA ligase [Alphaproteobacteria bacterium]